MHLIKASPPKIFILFLVFSFYSENISAQPSSCPNLDFETGTLVNWAGFTGTCCPIVFTNTGIIPGRHTIMTGAGVDPNSQGQIPVVYPDGGNFSVRLGNEQVGRQAEMLQYVVSVTPQSALFIYRYAVVLEDPVHSASEQPRFEIRLYDQNGVNIQCGMYNVVASANIPGFQNFGQVRYKTWTTVGIDLSPYLGQSVTIEFRTGDCDLGGHFGYAYIDCSCGPLEISNAFCPNSPDVTLKAPEGFYSYLWSNGSTLDSIVVPSNNVGVVYSCTLTSVTGCSVTLSTSIASTSIDANFNTVTQCQNYASFADQSTAFNGAPILWTWDFGDGFTSNSRDPVHIFQSPGTYMIQLISESDKGCKDTSIQQVLIWPAPDANAIVQDVCAGIPMHFIDSSSIAFGNLLAWNWSFSDGTTNQSRNPSQPFNSGSYFGQLIVTSDLGCLDTTSFGFTVHSPPLIDAGPDTSLCGGDTIAIGNVNNPLLLYHWWPLNGIDDAQAAHTTVIIPNPVQGLENYAYLLTGKSTVTGCETTDTVVIQSRGVPEAYFDPPEVQCFLSNNIDLSAHQTYSTEQYLWALGQNAQPAFAYSRNVQGIHYMIPGTHSVHLLVDNFGCTDSATATIRIVDEPKINISVNETGCPPLDILFRSHILPPGPLSYEWNFSDNSVSSEEIPIHTFSDPGYYGFSLKVVDPDGCADSVNYTNVIHVLPSPTSAFSVDKSVASITNPNFSFLNQSSNGHVLNWDFGDENISAYYDAEHTYRDTGYFLVKLIMQNNLGCTDTSVKRIKVEPYYTFYVPNSFTPNGDGINDSFRGLGMYVKEYRMWIYDRWGRVIYFTSDYETPWDGKGENKTTAQNEVYNYKINVIDTNDEQHEYIGKVTLVR